MMRISHLFRHELIGRALKITRPILILAAKIWRKLLFRTRFIAITGSLGKTTTKEILGKILKERYPTFVSIRNQNANRLVALNLLRVRPWHQFAVFELATSGPGQLIVSAELVQPHIAVITSIAATHISNYRSVDEIAEEKKTLLDALLEKGIGIVNGNEPRLESVKSNRHYQILRFGESENSEYDLNASRLSAKWPHRLSFDLADGVSNYRVKTQLVGEHWISSILAAFLAAQECGVPISKSVDSILSLKPFDARLQPVRLPQGSIMIRDEYNGSKSTYLQSLKILAEAEAIRRILIAGDVSDVKTKPRQRLRDLGVWAAQSCDIAVFVGEHTRHARRAAEREGMSPDSIFEFISQEETADFLKDFLREGDLTLLKGRTSLHLSRILFAQIGQVKCARAVCSERFLCDICWRLGVEHQDRSKLVPL